MLIRTMIWMPCKEGHDILYVGENIAPRRFMCECLFCGKKIPVIIPEINTVQILDIPQEVEDFIKCLLS